MPVATDPARVAEVAKALGHPARVRIVDLLAHQRECRGAEVFAELNLAQSTVSEHLRILRDAGVVSASPIGTSTVYCLRPEVLFDLGQTLVAIADRTPGCATGEAC